MTRPIPVAGHPSPADFPEDERDRFALFTRVRTSRSAWKFIPAEIYAPTSEGGRLAIATVRQDALDAKIRPVVYGLYDVETHAWIEWPWGCPGCGGTGGPNLCGDCRRDLTLGEPVGETRAAFEEDVSDALATAARDTYEPKFIYSR